MKKVLVGVIVLAVAFGVAAAASAEQKETLKIKAKEVETKEGTEVKVTGEGQTPESKSQVKGTIKEGGAEKEAEVTTTAKGTKPVLERKVKFHSYDQGTDTVTVVQEKRLVRYPTKDLDSKRPYVLKWEKDAPITITSTYDPKLGKDVVIDAATAPLQEKAPTGEAMPKK